MLNNLKSNYLDRWRYVSIGLILTGVALWIGADWYWSNICGTKICEVYFIDAYLAPLREAGLVIAVLAAPFLWLPIHYFKTWLLWIFTPLALLTLHGVSQIDPNSSNMFADTRGEAVADTLLPALIITAIFIAGRYLVLRRHRHRYYLIGLLIVIGMGLFVYHDPYLSTFALELVTG